MLLSKPENEETYEALISLIENSQGRLAPIVVGCDDEVLRARVIDRYEAEAKVAKIPAYRITLGTEPSITRALAQLKASEMHLQGSGAAVFTVTGAEYLLWIKTHEEDAQSELDKFFGYLQWTREALREYPYPIVIWVPHRILRQMSQRAKDFWSWRKAVLRFVDESAVPAVAVDWERSAPIEINSGDTFLPPLEELLEEIQQLEARSPNSASLATLNHKLGQVYAWRVEHGEAQNLAEEQEAAIAAFENAIANQKSRQDETALVDSLTHLGNFLHSQSHFTEALASCQQALDLSQKIQDKRSTAISLGNLGNIYTSLGQYQYGINFHQKALDLARETGDKQWEAASLGNLGNDYNSLGQYQHAIEIHQQQYQIARAIGDKQSEAISLGSLGSIYNSLGQYQRAIVFLEQHKKIAREIGHKQSEVSSLGNLGIAYKNLGQYQRAIELLQESLDLAIRIGDKQGQATSLFNRGLALKDFGQTADATRDLQQARSIYSDMQIDQDVKECEEELAKLQF